MFPDRSFPPRSLARRCHLVLAGIALLASGACQAGKPPPSVCEIGPPELFGADVLSTSNAEEWAFAFDRAGTTVLLQRGDFTRYSLYQSTLGPRGWSQPVPMALSRPDANDSDAFITPDGTRLFFSTNRDDAGTKADFDIWVAERRGRGDWSHPRKLGAAINSGGNEWLPSVAKNGSLYFESDREGGKTHLYRARFNGRDYEPAQRLPFPINSDSAEESPFIAPDESYLIFQRGGGQLFISYRNGQRWSDPVLLDLPASTLKYSPYVSPDGRFLYFTSNARGTSDIYRSAIRQGACK